MTKQEKVILILDRLHKVWPEPKTALNYSTPLELLIATILSAQTTDKLVNTITPDLFNWYPKADDYAKADLSEIKAYISKVNFANNKAKNIKASSAMIMNKFDGIVPDNMEDLDSLPGVARKTANVVLGNVFHKAEGIVVDTHVKRLSRRLGLTVEISPEKIEKDLMAIVPRKNWVDFSHLLINFGREYCPARPHNCKDCPLKNLCPDLAS